MEVNGITIKIHLKYWEDRKTASEVFVKEVNRLSNIFFINKNKGMVAILIEPGEKIQNISISIPEDDCSGDITREAFDKLLPYLSTVANKIEYAEVESIQYELNDYVERGILKFSEAHSDGSPINSVTTYYYDLLKYQ